METDENQQLLNEQLGCKFTIHIVVQYTKGKTKLHRSREIKEKVFVLFFLNVIDNWNA